MRNRFRTSAASALALLLGIGVSTSAHAVIYDFTTVNNGLGDAATAEFNFTSPTSFTVTLTDTGNITDLANELTDFHFVLSGTPGNVTLGTITSGGSYDCTNLTSSSACANTFNSSTNANGSWGLAQSGSTVNISAGNNNALHPDAIINSSFVTNIAMDGLRNQQHNPVLLGPVTFSFTAPGETSIPTISSVIFSFGTGPDFVNGTPTTPVPEPASLALLGVGMIGVGYLVRRKNPTRGKAA